jgi:hypothetical protein
MPSGTTPRIGDWYKSSIGEFEIVAQDDDEDTLELQHCDGALEELDREIWEQLEPRQVEPPEDWDAPLDVAMEDRAHPDCWAHPVDWLSALDRMD